MKYQIDEKDSGIDISISAAKHGKLKLLETCRACQEGRCSCQNC